MAQILLGYTPGSLFGSQQFIKAFFLFLPGNMKKKLDDNCAIPNQKFFKGIDLLIGLRKLKRRKRRIKMIDLYSTIPAAVKDRDLSSGRKLGPETPKIRMHPLVLILLLGRINREPSGI